jgi:hypothetical protein
MKVPKLLAIAVGLGVALVPAASSASTSASSAIINQAGAFVGYGTIPLTGSTNSFRSVTATWTVPHVTCTYNLQSVYQGVALGKGNGLDRTNPRGGEGAGIWAFCSSAGSTPTYDTAFNAGGSLQVHSAINPGDTITATVSYSATTKEYTFTVTDLNNLPSSISGYTYPCQGNCSNASAWVSLSGDSQLLAGFGQANFVSIKITDSAGHKPGWPNPRSYLLRNEAIGVLRQGMTFSRRATVLR